MANIVNQDKKAGVLYTKATIDKTDVWHHCPKIANLDNQFLYKKSNIECAVACLQPCSDGL
jgi:hypothetical protein